MRFTDFPVVGRLHGGEALRRDLANTITRLQVQGRNSDVNGYVASLTALLGSALTFASNAPRKGAAGPLTAGATAAQGSAVVLAFGFQPKSAALPATAAFTVSGTTVTNVLLVSRFVILTTAAPAGASFTVTYTKPGSNKLLDTSNNEVPNFSIAGVTA